MQSETNHNLRQKTSVVEISFHQQISCINNKIKIYKIRPQYKGFGNRGGHLILENETCLQTAVDSHITLSCLF